MISSSLIVTLQVSKAINRKAKPVMDKSLPFGKYFTDHMLEIEWNATTGFGVPSISPHHPLSLDPAVPALHYAVQCFEGWVLNTISNHWLELYAMS